MSYVALLFAILGAALVTAKRSEIRVLAFISYNISNIFWMLWCTQQDPFPSALFLQLIIFFILSTWGLINNIKSIKNPQD